MADAFALFYRASSETWLKAWSALAAHYGNCWLRCFRLLYFCLHLTACKALIVVARAWCDYCSTAVIHLIIAIWIWITHKIVPHIRYVFATSIKLRKTWCLCDCWYWAWWRRLNFAWWTAAIWAGHNLFTLFLSLLWWRFEKRIRTVNASCCMRRG